MSRLRLLVRRPGPLLGRDAGVDHARALAQWREYVRVVHEAGWDALEADPADDSPEAVFVEDLLVVYGHLAVLGRPGDGDRSAELPGLADAANELGYRTVELEGGHLDGGDVLKFGGTVWIGMGSRTDHPGAEALAGLLAPFDVRVVTVPLEPGWRLKKAMTALPDGTILGRRAPEERSRPRAGFLDAPEESGAAVVLLGADSVLLSSSAPRTAALLRERGLRVHEVDISEFEKLGRGVTSLSVRLRD